MRWHTLLILLHIKSWIHMVDIFLIQFLPEQLYRLAETLEMNDLPFPEEFDHIVHIRVIGKPQNIIVGHTRLLFSSQIFHQVCHRIALYLHGRCAPGKTGSRCGIYACGMIHKVRSKCRILNLGILQISGQLMHDGSDHLQMTQFFCPCIRFKKELPQVLFPGQLHKNKQGGNAMKMSFRFAGVDGPHSVSAENNADFLLHIQQAVLLSLKETQQLTETQYRHAEEALLQQYRNALKKSNHD